MIQVIDSTPERIESMRRLQASKQFAKVADVIVISLEATQAHGLLCKEMILLMRQSERRIKELWHAVSYGVPLRSPSKSEERHTKARAPSTCKRAHEEKSSLQSKRQCTKERSSSICQRNHEEDFHGNMRVHDGPQVAKEELNANQEGAKAVQQQHMSEVHEEGKAVQQQHMSEVHEEGNSPRPHYEYPRYEPISSNKLCAKCSVPWNSDTVEILTEKDHSTVIKDFIFFQNPNTDRYEVCGTWRKEPRRIIDLAARIANVNEADKAVVMLKEVLVHLIHSRSMGLNENASSTMFCMKYYRKAHETVWLEVGCLSCARRYSIPLAQDLEFNGFAKVLVDILKPQSST